MTTAARWMQDKNKIALNKKLVDLFMDFKRGLVEAGIV